MSLFADGKVIPTELQAEADELRKKMKFDDSEREGQYCVSKLMNEQIEGLILN